MRSETVQLADEPVLVESAALAVPAGGQCMRRQQGSGSANPPSAPMSYGSQSCRSPLNHGDQRNAVMFPHAGESRAPRYTASARMAVRAVVPRAIQQGDVWSTRGKHRRDDLIHQIRMG
jgi:hypothetical protein